MQRLAAAVTVVAAGGEGARVGLTASSVTSLTGEPPTLLVCVNRDTGSHPAILDDERFSVNVLSRDQEAVAGVFAGFTGLEGEEKFSAGDWSEGQLGVPVLKGAQVVFECRVDAHFPRSTHDIIVGLIETVHISEEAFEPLLYADRAFGGFTE